MAKNMRSTRVTFVETSSSSSDESDGIRVKEQRELPGPLSRAVQVPTIVAFELLTGSCSQRAVAPVWMSQTHSCQPSQNGWGSPGSLVLVPVVSRLRRNTNNVPEFMRTLHFHLLRWLLKPQAYTVQSSLVLIKQRIQF